jgi:hypothetical protein
MSTTSRVAGAVAAGYVLGRFKKLRLAVLVGSAMASPKFRNAAAGMLENRIPGGAITTTLTKEVGGRLVDIGKTAATSIVASRIDNLSQSLADRSQNLRGGRSGEQAEKSRADEEEGEETQEPEDEYEEEEEGEESQEQDAQASDDASKDEEPEEPVTRSPRRRRSASPAGRRRG